MTRYTVTKGFHYKGEIYSRGAIVEAADFPQNIIDWLISKGCLMLDQAAPAERKRTRNKKGG